MMPPAQPGHARGFRAWLFNGPKTYQYAECILSMIERNALMRLWDGRGEAQNGALQIAKSVYGFVRQFKFAAERNEREERWQSLGCRYEPWPLCFRDAHAGSAADAWTSQRHA